MGVAAVSSVARLSATLTGSPPPPSDAMRVKPSAHSAVAVAQYSSELLSVLSAPVSGERGREGGMEGRR